MFWKPLCQFKFSRTHAHNFRETWKGKSYSRIPSAVSFWIPRPRILDSTCKNFPDSGIWILLHRAILKNSPIVLKANFSATLPIHFDNFTILQTVVFPGKHPHNFRENRRGCTSKGVPSLYLNISSYWKCNPSIHICLWLEKYCTWETSQDNYINLAPFECFSDTSPEIHWPRRPGRIQCSRNRSIPRKLLTWRLPLSKSIFWERFISNRLWTGNGLLLCFREQAKTELIKKGMSHIF